VGVLVTCILYSKIFLNLTELFLSLTEVFPCFFLGCKANARVKLAKTGHGPHSSTLVCICVVRLLFVLFYVLCVNVYCHRVTTQLQLINIYHIIYHNYFTVSAFSSTYVTTNWSKYVKGTPAIILNCI
jgi:hypothetical protein